MSRAHRWQLMLLIALRLRRRRILQAPLRGFVRYRRSRAMAADVPPQATHDSVGGTLDEALLSLLCRLGQPGRRRSPRQCCQDFTGLTVANVLQHFEGANGTQVG